MKHICFFGDGVTQGLGDRHHMGWPERLALLERNAGHKAQAEHEGHALACYNLAVAWDTSADVALRWHGEAAARLQDYRQAGVIFSFGHGDMVDCDGSGVQVPLWDSASYAEALLCEAALCWPTLWVGPSPVMPQGVSHRSGGRHYTLNAGRVEALNKAYSTIARQRGIPYLDLIAELQKSESWATALADGGGLFPRDAGHQAIAECVYEWASWRRWMDHGFGGGVAVHSKELPPQTLLTPKMVAAGY